MNFDPTTVVPDYPSAEAEKALDLEKWNVAPTKQGAVVPPPGKGGGGGGMAILVGLAGLAVLAGLVAAGAVRLPKGKRRR